MVQDFGWADWVGILGALVIAAAYFAATRGRLPADGAGFNLWNLLGAALVLTSLWARPNVGAIVIEVLWALIALSALLRLWLGRRR